jgi:hypothetical protein
MEERDDSTEAPRRSTIQVWAPGTVDVSKGKIRIKGYAV